MHITFPQHWIPAAKDAISRQHDYIRSVYRWMSCGLLLTALASAWAVFSPALSDLLFHHGVIVGALFAAELAAAFALSPRIERLTPATAAALFVGFALLNGILLGGLALAMATMEIFQAFAAAAAVFAAGSTFGMLSHRDPASESALRFMALAGAGAAAAISGISRHPLSAAIVALAGTAVFLALIRRDREKLATLAAKTGEADAHKYAAVGALSLYLGFFDGGPSERS